jgi:hypothetical protein
MKRIRKDHVADAYAEATDGCRCSVWERRDSARQELRDIDADQAIQDAEEREARRESQSARKR